MRDCAKLSVVIPVYFNEENLAPLYEDLRARFISQIAFDYELVFVDDGSADGSWEQLCRLAEADSHVRLFRLSRNFGSHAAILCGLANATGDCAVVKAADLQEPTELILDLYRSWQEGNNAVLAVREDREDKSLFSSLYYWMTRKLALPNMPKGGFDTFLVDRRVIEVLERMDETDSAITGQILWGGFRTGHVYYRRRAREVGKSRWTLKKKLGLVANTLFSFSLVPITVVNVIGAVSFIGSIVWAIVVLISRIAGKIDVQGWTTLFIFNLFSFGIIMLSLGILGGYLWRSFNASRARPPYIVEETREGAKDAAENSQTNNSGTP